MDFGNLTDVQVRNWFIRNRVCVVTNASMRPGSLFVASLRKYIDYVPTHNFWCIPGQQTNGRSFYGKEALVFMLEELLSDKRFNYVIYIDEDCFISDFRLLLSDFEIFMEDGACLGGIQDGGTICHRNHSALLVNTFLSYWNLKALRAADFQQRYRTNSMMSYGEFRDFVVKNDSTIGLWERANAQIERARAYREANFPDGKVPYCTTVENDPSNPCEPHQVPYSHDDERAVNNFEPYYQVEEEMIRITGKHLYYLNSADLYTTEETELDNSGMTSVVMTTDGKKFAYHTWFSRAYDAFSQHPVCKTHTERINKIVKNI